MKVRVNGDEVKFKQLPDGFVALYQPPAAGSKVEIEMGEDLILKFEGDGYHNAFCLDYGKTQ